MKSQNVQLAATFFQRARLGLDGLSQLLWPATCVCCQELISPQDRALCSQCWEKLHQAVGLDYCRRCGATGSRYVGTDTCEFCRDADMQIDAIARVGTYAQVLASLVVSFKNDRTELLGHISNLFGAAFEASPFYRDIDMLVPVPLHWRRRISRGYNQSQLICKAIRHPSAKISMDLARIRNTKPQPSIEFQDRHKNIAGAFAVRRHHGFEDKTVCLIDDVKTSGATLNECARVLKGAGAKNVYAMVVAVAGDQMRDQ